MTGDIQRIKQVLMNILSNAVKYTQENGQITIDINEKVTWDGFGDYEFVFEDNGRGMKPEFLDKIFFAVRTCQRQWYQEYTGDRTRDGNQS